jgi:hypothetical protein
MSNVRETEATEKFNPPLDDENYFLSNIVST